MDNSWPDPAFGPCMEEGSPTFAKRGFWGHHGIVSPTQGCIQQLGFHKTVSGKKIMKEYLPHRVIFHILSNSTRSAQSVSCSLPEWRQPVGCFWNRPNWVLPLVVYMPVSRQCLISVHIWTISGCFLWALETRFTSDIHLNPSLWKEQSTKTWQRVLVQLPFPAMSPPYPTSWQQFLAGEGGVSIVGGEKVIPQRYDSCFTCCSLSADRRQWHF